MEQRIIQQVKDLYDKQHTYKTWKGRYKKAIDNGFYYEANSLK